ncbi:nucleoside hydrolase [Candidatus Woesearchaeota archaeon]|nr:nucleoside hydrolase [Candidatus Woesearchaeota archaeon]
MVFKPFSFLFGKQKKEKIILDTDIGSDVDDALALLFGLKSPYISLDGITTVYGTTDVRAKISRKIVDYTGRDIEIHAGEQIGLHTPRIWHTGREGEGILTEEEFSKPLHEMKIGEQAVDYLIEKIMGSSKEYTIVAIGSLTNIARALLKEPRFQDNVKQLYIMGGVFGNDYGREPEHNIYNDIKGAQIVLNSKIPITLFPLNITAQVPILRDDFEQMQESEVSRSVKALVDVWFDYRDTIFGRRCEYTCMHDPLTLAAVVHPELVRTQMVHVDISRNGITRLDKANGKNIKVATSVDYDKFREIFFGTILRKEY